MADRVHRITMFKVPDPAEQKVLCSQYETLFASQTKVSPTKPNPSA